MAINKIQFGNQTLIDLSTDTVESAADIVSGKVGHLRDGSVVTGTASGGGGSSSWTKVAETSYTVSTTTTTTSTVATWETGKTELWTSSKIVYVRIRDMAGKRNGYFYGTDEFFFNVTPLNNPASTATVTNAIMVSWSYSDSAYLGRYGYETTGYGLFASRFFSNGNIRLSSRYNSTYSKTINGTYKVEVYLLDPAGGVPIFT